ncbi:hypothetical protein ACFVIM_31205 [Streptomyces sp. NPDC057638]|uniref:hypothetical protein n=1 Tax=Streptomyces sp. NPDC057638 TaxID=3346190 RepID=UPI003687150A
MNPHHQSRSLPTPADGVGRPVRGGLTAAVVALIPLLAVGGGDGFRAALDFTTGVLSLVSLTASIAWGLLATDRLLLAPRHRLLAQAVHRATATAALGFLLLHATVKVSLGRVDLIGALLPFGLGTTGSAALVGFGTLAGLLMVATAATGALRSALAANTTVAGRWRALHTLAYPAWCLALVHGLFAGRPAATWVVVLYCLALATVTAMVSVRLLPRSLQRRLAARILSLTDPADHEPSGSGTAPPRVPQGDAFPAYSPRREMGTGHAPAAFAAPSHHLRIEVPPPPTADPLVTRPVYGEVTRPPTAPGSAMSAAYRAVSLPDDRAPRPHRAWPTPSPPPPSPAFAPPPPYPPYPPPTEAYGGAEPPTTAGTPGGEPPTRPPQDDPTRIAPGPLYPPPAGEPWPATPAGDQR